MVACHKPENVPQEPSLPSYSGLPIVSYTVVSTDQVLASGDIPAGCLAAFKSSYNRKNQLTASNSATLTLTGTDGMKIRSITLHMRSNKSSGAGSLEVTNEGAPVWVIDNAVFSSTGWHGSYTTDTVPVFHLFDPQVSCGHQLQIKITASANSLYIFRYDIEYEPSPEPSNAVMRDTALVSGLKTVCFGVGYRMTGPIVDYDAVYTLPESDPVTTNDIYDIEYFDDSTATIQHYASGSYIGFSKGKLSDYMTRWSVVLMPDTTFTFYTRYQNQYYTFYPDPDNGMICVIKGSKNLWQQRIVLQSVDLSR